MRQLLMAPWKFSAVIVTSFYYVLLAGCMAEADHTHPLDPRSDAFRNEGSLVGKVSRLNGTGLPAAEVRLEPGPFVSVSGEGGEFQFNGVPPGGYELSISKEGFAASPDSVVVRLAELTEIVKQVDAVPVFSTITVSTGKLTRPAPQADQYLLDVVAVVEDPDGAFDLDSVWMEIPEANYAGPLNVTSTAPRFRASVTASQLSVGTMHPLVGKYVVLHAKDHAGFTSNAARVVSRVIDDVPLTISQIVTAQAVELTWEVVDLPFPFTNRVDIYRSLGAGVQEFHHSIADIDAKTSSIHLEIVEPGDYFWTISVVDKFGNWSQSIPAGFTVL